MILNDEYVYTDNPIYVEMSSYHTLEAHFNENLPTCSLTVNAYEYSTLEQVPTNVYVDSQYIGIADDSFDISLGTRTVSVDEWAYVSGLGDVCAWYIEIGGQLYDYGTSIEITVWTLHQTITFVYIYQ